MDTTDPSITADNPDRPEWLPENFKAPEDLVSSYTELQRTLTERGNANRNLEQIVASQQAQIEQIQATQTQQPEPDQNEWYTAFEQDPIATQKALAEQTYDQRFSQWQETQQKALQDLQNAQISSATTAAYGELDAQYSITEEQKEEMARVINEHPYLIPNDAVYDAQKYKGILENVYRIAVPNPGPPQTTSADLQRTMKLQAQTATGAGGHLSTADEDAQRWQEISNASTGKLGL